MCRKARKRNEETIEYVARKGASEVNTDVRRKRKWKRGAADGG